VCVHSLLSATLHMKSSVVDILWGSCCGDYGSACNFLVVPPWASQAHSATLTWNCTLPAWPMAWYCDYWKCQESPLALSWLWHSVTRRLLAAWLICGITHHNKTFAKCYVMIDSTHLVYLASCFCVFHIHLDWCSAVWQ